MESEELVEILSRGDRDELNEFALVLAAQAIHCEVRWDGYRWLLSVPASFVARARLEVAAYQAESRLTAPAGLVIQAYGRPWPGIVAFVAVLVIFGLLAPALGFGIDWLEAGRMDGARLRNGEWWRPVTALMLHADAPHLLGNLLFGGFFGYSVTRYLGSGVGWLAIVVCGAVGNVFNGYFSGPDHRSIGASTAVFAALGLLSAYLWRRGFPPGASSRERLAPVIAGIGLLAFTGTGGENTDIGAHLTGFVAGFGGGLLAAGLGVSARRSIQAASAGMVTGLIAVCWVWAVLVYA